MSINIYGFWFIQLYCYGIWKVKYHAAAIQNYTTSTFLERASYSKSQLEVNNGAWIVFVEEAQSKYTVPGLSLVLVLRLYLAQYGISTV